MIDGLLAGERIVLRRHALTDFPASYAMWSDPQVVRFIGGAPSTEHQAWMRITSYVGMWALLGYSMWVVEEKATQRFVGEVGFFDLHRDIDPVMRDVPEIGWAFIPDAWGHGYATEAVRIALHWGDAHLAVARTVCLISEDNGASVRVAEKCGYARFGSGTFNGNACTFFERRRPDRD
jgi:RimJ/RimL family protein N-acetyltransferase